MVERLCFFVRTCLCYNVMHAPVITSMNMYLVVNVYDSLPTHCTLQLPKKEEVILV